MSASRSDLLDAAAIRYVTELFSGESSGHDVHHTLRVYRTALSIADLEGGDRTVIALAALLHDTDDPKLFHTENLQNARKFLQSHYTSQALEESVCSIIQRLSFRGSGTSVPASLEG